MTKPNDTFTLSVRDLEIIEEALGAKGCMILAAGAQITNENAEKI